MPKRDIYELGELYTERSSFGGCFAKNLKTGKYPECSEGNLPVEMLVFFAKNPQKDCISVKLH